VASSRVVMGPPDGHFMGIEFVFPQAVLDCQTNQVGGDIGCVLEDYNARMVREFDEIKKWLPARVESVLDIGAGLGGIDIMIANHCGPIKIHLLDGDGDEEVRRMSYGKNRGAWADRNLGVEFVRANVDTDCRVVGVETSVHSVPADLILSLMSWGFHYQVSYYAEMVRRSLNRGGRVILDIRNRSDGLQEMLDAGFKLIGIAQVSKKAKRAVFE
jgi:SAM-dependent methyltransferase